MADPTILIVDDEGELAFTLAERLELRGFRAKGVTSGDAALELIGTDAFDAIVMDVKMPGTGGLAALQAIKQHQPALPVILVTGHGSRESAEEGLRLGAFRYLMKPVQIDDLVRLLREAVADGRHEP